MGENVSPVELRQLLYEAAADELGKNQSNVVEAIVVHRVVERVIQEAMPFLDYGIDEPRTRPQDGRWYARLWRKGVDQ